MHLSRRSLLALAATAGLAPLAARAGIVDSLGPGAHPLGLEKDRDGVIYVPKSATPGQALPLMVMLHGAGGSSASAPRWHALADEFMVVMLAPDSRDPRTWDLILGGFGPDVAFIARAVSETRRRCRIDESRLTLAGFSDGASYALSLGIGAGDLFSRLIAFSPGVMQPDAVRGKPRIFLSHGTRDGVIPIDASSRVFAPRLKALGYDVTYEEFDGRHEVPDAIARDAFRWALA